jgi:SAM-dependent methyltransferase
VKKTTNRNKITYTMLQTAPFENHTAEYEAWFDKHPAVFESEMLAIRSQFEKLPENLTGIEVGLGTGRYAQALGIREGVEPARNMRRIARSRGLDAMDAAAEQLPYKDLHFDFVLFVTICHLASAPEALREAHRVLKRGGSVLVGFIDRNAAIGKEYEARRANSVFYKHARFYSVDDVRALLRQARFKQPEFVQTLFGGGLNSIDEVQAPEPGTGRGSYVVVRAVK